MAETTIPILHSYFPCCGRGTKRLQAGTNRRSCRTCGNRYTVTVERSPMCERVGRTVLAARWERRTNERTVAR